MPRVIDAFPFWNETDMLELRVATLEGLVDLHIAVASEVTHAGKKNEMQYEGIPRPEYVKIAVLPVERVLEGEGIPATRRREMRQRNGIIDVLKMMALKPDDVVLVSDADEIPHPHVVSYIKEHGVPDGHVAVFMQRLCYYDLNTSRGYVWQGTRAVRYSDLLALSPHVVRYGLGAHDAHYPKYVAVHNAGWHLSYFGGPERVQQKMKNFLHQELVTDENTDAQVVRSRVTAGADIWGRADESFTVELTRDVPPPVLNNPRQWRHLWRSGYEMEGA
jgi:beta-1,4-mannosyl-glycoprotein beta-1,4-N-acetylglucosaminyltransferase